VDNEFLGMEGFMGLEELDGIDYDPTARSKKQAAVRTLSQARLRFAYSLDLE